MKYFIVAVFSFLLVACGGYKPVPQYSNEIFEQPVLTKVKIDAEDPDAGVYLQDEISKMAVNRLNLTLTKNVKEAKGYILVNSYTINTTPVNKDDNGNVIRYSVNAAIEFAIKDKYGFWSKNIVSNEYVSVKAQSLISVLEKEKASKLAIQKALDAFMVAVIKRSKDVNDGNKTLDQGKEDPLVNQAEPVEQSSEDVTNEDVAYDSMQDTTQDSVEVSSDTETENGDLKIIPVDDSQNLVEDATEYN